MKLVKISVLSLLVFGLFSFQSDTSYAAVSENFSNPCIF